MKIWDGDTIAAISTPIGEGAIAVVRVSGGDAVRLVDSLFAGKQKLEDVPGNTVHLGKVFGSSGEVVDEVLATVFRAPHSYTGEDTVEISCHGGIFVANRVLETVLAAGARQAEPGEYTKRAFLNGKMDLSQAEAVADLIRARSQKAHISSLGQLEGKLSTWVWSLESDLLRLCALLELELDFSEEGIQIVPITEVKRLLLSVQERLNEMIRSYEVGRHYRDGVSVVLAGRPNVGKSSLFNALLRENRAIVSPAPGTTRDYIEEAVVLDGMLYRLVDTAGLRETAEMIESEGVARSWGLLRKCDIALIVVDESVASSRNELVAQIRKLDRNTRVLIAHNKIDLLGGGQSRVSEFLEDGIKGFEVWVSARTGEGLHYLTSSLTALISVSTTEGPTDVKATTRRHVDAFQRCLEALDRALSSMDSRMTNEFIALDVRQAIDSLSEVTGEVTTEDMLNEIFSRFCVGK